MRGCDPLAAAFNQALNAELSALGCKLRVAEDAGGDDTIVVLIDDQGVEMGRLPDHADATIIAAVGVIIDRWRREAQA